MEEQMNQIEMITAEMARSNQVLLQLRNGHAAAMNGHRWEEVTDLQDQIADQTKMHANLCARWAAVCLV